MTIFCALLALLVATLVIANLVITITSLYDLSPYYIVIHLLVSGGGVVVEVFRFSLAKFGLCGWL